LLKAQALIDVKEESDVHKESGDAGGEKGNQEEKEKDDVYDINQIVVRPDTPKCE